MRCVVKLKRNVAILGQLIAEYRYNGDFNSFVSEELRQSIIAIGSEGITPTKRDYADKLLEKEDL